jgi:hypothetical protein
MHFRSIKSWGARILDFDRRNLPPVFKLVSATSLAGLLISFLRWQLVSVLTVFIEPILEIAVFGAFGAALVWAIVHALLPFRGQRANRFSPLLLGACVCLLFVSFPFTAVYLKINFMVLLHERTLVAERLVRSVQSSAPMDHGRGDMVHLDGLDSQLSDGGDIMYWHNQGRQMVFFFTFRGILDHFSGFVYSANDRPPEREDFGGEWIEVTRIRKNWYWAASI